MAEPAPGPGRSARPARSATAALRLGALVAVVAAMLVAVIVVTAGRPAVYPSDGPEAAFQRYLAAWDAGDLEAAWSSFSDRIRAGTSAAEYADEILEFGADRSADRRVLVVERRVDDARARLGLRVEEYVADGGWGGGDLWSWEVTVVLVREDDAWHLDTYLAGLDPMPAPDKE